MGKKDAKGSSDPATVLVPATVALDENDENAGNHLANHVINVQNADKNKQYIGLGVLNDIDGVYIKQEWEILEQISTWYEQSNKYTVFDPNGKIQLFQAREKTSCCYRMCCGKDRPFNFKVYDTTGKKDKPAMVLKRHYRCCGWAVIPCCAHRVDVHYMVDTDGNTIGSTSDRTLISQVQVPWFHGGCCFPTWKIKDRNGKKQATVTTSSMFVCDLCGGGFDVNDAKGDKVGQIEKLSPKNMKQMALEVVSEADNFRLTFDKTMDPTIKLALMAATLQIDFTFFEDDRGPCQCRLCDFWCCGFACPCLPAWMYSIVCCCRDTDKKKRAGSRGTPAVETMER